MHYENLRRGMSFVRRAIALAVTDNAVEAAGYARSRWGANSDVAIDLATKDVAAVDISEIQDNAAVEFFELVASRAIVGKIGLRPVAAHSPVIGQTEAAVAYWISEGAHITLSRAVFDTRTSLGVKRAAALTIFPQDLLLDTDPASEESVRRDLAKSVVRLLDAGFLDPTNSGAVGPASVTYGVSPLASANDIKTDIDAAVAAFAGDLDSAVWIASPRLAVQIGLSGSGAQQYDCGARGGTLAGIPLFTSEACPFDSNGGDLVLLDPDRVAYLDQGLTVRRSMNATVEVTDPPSGESSGPTGATSLVSLFQTDCVGLLTVARVNWQAMVDDAVIVVGGCDYRA